MKNLLARAPSWLKLRLHRCEHEGCWKKGDACYVPAEGQDDVFYYCHEHAYDAGFCRGCGQFYMGIDSFDSSTTGLCEHCENDFRHDKEDDSDDLWDQL